MPASRRLILLGTYDAWRNRNRVLLEGLRDRGWEVLELNASAFAGTDRGQLRRWRVLVAALGHLWAWLGLASRYLRAPAHRAVLVAHLGPVDAPFAALLARLRGVRLYSDLSVPLAEAALDRGLVREGSWTARLLAVLDGLCVRLSHRVLGDSAVHCAQLCRRYRWPRRRWLVVPVGASDRAFPSTPGPSAAAGGVLFYGHYLRLQGAPCIVRAASLWPPEIRLLCIGAGDEEAECRKLAAGLGHIRFLPVQSYPRLIESIRAAELVLGIFGATPKAAAVVPNKVYEALAAGRPVITAAGPAQRELLPQGAVHCVPPEDPQALARAVEELFAQPARLQKLAERGRAAFELRFRPVAVVESLHRALTARGPGPDPSRGS